MVQGWTVWGKWSRAEWTGGEQFRVNGLVVNDQNEWSSGEWSGGEQFEMTGPGVNSQGEKLGVNGLVVNGQGVNSLE